jgi:hypothetical protein
MPDMPRLSADLPGPRSPDRCQNCSVGGPLEVWREHDDADQPQEVFVVLCPACAARLVEPHARLYSRVEPHAPVPGAMPLCLDCKHRDGVRCTTPKARLNGGPGIKLSMPEATQMHLCRRGKGQRSGWITIYNGPVFGCDGKEARP